MIKKALIAIVALLLVIYLAWHRGWVQYALVAWSLPEFPSWPQPVATLASGDSGKIYYATASPYDFDALLRGAAATTPTTGLGYLTFPAVNVDTPIPAVIILSGSGGITPGREHEYAALLNQQGIAAFVVDYYLPRGVSQATNYILRVSAVTEFDVVTDAYAALKLLASHPDIDENRIGLMGFSYGGMATRFAMDQRFHRVLAPDVSNFALHIDVYGPCFQNLQTAEVDDAPLLTLRGTEDNSNDLEACVRRESELRALGVEVESHVYPDAGHAWESDATRSMKDDAPYIVGCEISYDRRGFAYLNGDAFSHNADNTGRIGRIVTRLGSGKDFQQCLQYGYIIGKDEQTQQRANAAILQFLARHFAGQQRR